MTTKSSDRIPGDVMLVGSLPFDDVEEAMRAAAEGLRGHASMLPDGEVGLRQWWVGFIRSEVYSGHPQLEEYGRPESGVVEQPERDQAEEGEARGGEADWVFRVKPGADLSFDDLHYGQAALDSYRVFERLRDEGVIEPQVRFQVGLPSPDSAVNSFFVDPDEWPQGYTQHMSRRLDARSTRC